MKPIKGPTRAEFDRDWRTLEAVMGERARQPDGADEAEPAQAFADTQRLREFHIKHRARLEAMGRDVTGYLAELEAADQELRDSMVVLDKAQDRNLQAQADLTDSLADAGETMFHILRFYESRSQADWDTQTPEQQIALTDIMARLRADVPAFLASLPVEKRRQLEALGPWQPGEDTTR